MIFISERAVGVKEEKLSERVRSVGVQKYGSSGFCLFRYGMRPHIRPILPSPGRGRGWASYGLWWPGYGLWVGLLCVVLWKTVFWFPKGNLLHAERPPFRA